MCEQTGMLFDIQRFCIHDGPGIRTTVFFKGCNLRCFWCHNPESYSPKPELSFFPDKCIGCGRCLSACVHGCNTADEAGGHSLDRSRCDCCGACAHVCQAGALVMNGKPYTISEIMNIVAADTPFYKRSGGGMTCSGGEPLLQSKFVMRLMRTAKAAGLHTALDTAGNVGYEAFERILPYADLILYDLKCMDSDIHQRVTGVKNQLILENLKRILSEQVPVWIRIPVIPGVNDNPINMRETARFLKKAPNVQRLELLPYHSLGAGKYESLGIPLNPDEVLRPPDRDALTALAREFACAEYEVVLN